MSVAEMKLEAISQSHIKDEDSLTEILSHFSKLNNLKALNLPKHYDVIKVDYQHVLKRLAQ